jgi:hypothetical protein
MTFPLIGYVKDAAGAVKVGLAVNLYNTTDLTTSLANTTTSAAGMWTFTELDPAIVYAVKITDGTKNLWLDARTKVQFAGFEVPLAGCPSGLKTVMLNFVIDGGGVAITTGVKGDIQIPFGCTIKRVTTLADQAGSIVVDIWKDTYGNFPPTDADSITSATPPTLATAAKGTDATLTDWTVAVTALDILRFNVDSCTTITRCTVAIELEKS